jgi:superfamily II DNA or RNA helicase
MTNEDFDLLINGVSTEKTEKKPTAHLRFYQIHSRNAIFNAWERGLRSVMYQSPTGSGKTVTIGSIVHTFEERGLKTLTLAHRDELVDNIRNEYRDLFGIETAAIKAGLPRDYAINHQVASIATYVNALNFTPDLIITDEGHHCLAQTYLTIYAAHPTAKLLMVTATPYRLSGLGFTDICDELVLSMSVAQLESMGSLVPARLWAMTTFTHAQIAEVHVVKGEYNEREMSDLLSETRQIMSVVDTYIEKGDGKQMMLYATSVAHSKKLVEAFEWRGIKAGHVDGTSKDRKEIFRQFTSKEIQVLSNCEIATEGNNIPSIEIVGLARKTKSLSLYLQMVGRASRPWAGKTDYLLFDFVDNFWEHGLPNREHDWHSHFKGVTRKERRKSNEGEERQFMIETEDGQVFISNLAKLPDGFKGQILQEVDPLNTKHAELLRKRQEKLDEIKRKIQEKEEAQQRRLDEIERRKNEKLAEIQRKLDAKLAEIKRREDERLARIQRAEDLRLAKIKQKEDEIAAKLKKIEDKRLAKIQEEEDRKEGWRKYVVIRDIQNAAEARRKVEEKAFYARQDDGPKRRREETTALFARTKDADFSWTQYHDMRERHKEEEQAARAEYRAFGQYQRIEKQFETGIRLTHTMWWAVQRVCEFCDKKNYPMPTIANLVKMSKPYWVDGNLFTEEEFGKALQKIEDKMRITLLDE